MPIIIKKVSEGRYVATATPPDVHEEWSNGTPLDCDSLIKSYSREELTRLKW